MITSKTSYIFPLFLVVMLLSACENNNNANRTLAAPKVRDPNPKSEVSPRSEKPNKPVAVAGIEGTYVVKQEVDDSGRCMITLTVAKDLDGYHYRFTSKNRILNGRISLEADQANGGQIITFEGIEWSEYEGDISNEDETKEKEDLEIPVGVSGGLQNNEIIIQNYGNSMNYYVKLADCDKKYIVFQKQ